MSLSSDRVYEIADGTDVYRHEFGYWGKWLVSSRTVIMYESDRFQSRMELKAFLERTLGPARDINMDDYYWFRTGDNTYPVFAVRKDNVKIFQYWTREND